MYCIPHLLAWIDAKSIKYSQPNTAQATYNIMHTIWIMWCILWGDVTKKIILTHALMSEWMETGGYISSQVAFQCSQPAHKRPGKTWRSIKREDRPSNNSWYQCILYTVVIGSISLHFYWSLSYLVKSEISLIRSWCLHLGTVWCLHLLDCSSSTSYIKVCNLKSSLHLAFGLSCPHSCMRRTSPLYAWLAPTNCSLHSG